MADNTNQVSDVTEAEIQRRVARATRPLYEEITDLRGIVSACQNDLMRQNSIISRLTGDALNFGTLIQVQNSVDPNLFRTNDEVVVVDKSSSHYNKGGRIVSGLGGGVVVDEEGCTFVKLNDGNECKFSIGLAGKEPAQIRLSQKEDGTHAIVNLDGKPWQVRGAPDLAIQVGDSIKLRPDNKSIIGKAQDFGVGPICHVVAIQDDCVEVNHKGDNYVVHNPKNIKLEEGDRIACDTGMFCIIKKLPQDARERYKISTELTTTWDDVGGLDVAKQELRDAIELPYQHPELFKYYNAEQLRGVLLYGPPGCGKSLLARVCAWSMASLHGKKSKETSYIYVKSPEILDKWIGNTEQEIRKLFERGRRHYRENGYKAILVFDEADAIMPQRGTRTSSGIADTMVPMFLGEMDGVDSKQTEENPIVLLMTNRADSLDPAITRPGRISRHIKVDRPDEKTAVDILKIHSRSVPFSDEKNKEIVLTIVATDIFSKSRLLYRINNQHDFTFGDCINGASLENIMQIAKMNALHRDMASNKKTGVTIDDLRSAVQSSYRQQRGINHNYDLQDFSEKLGIQPQNMQVDRCFGAA